MAYTDIDKSDDYFNTVLYTGNASSRSITGVNFQPDWVWIKRRSTGDAHYLFDNVRTATKYISSNNTDAEITNANTLTSFDSDGFSLGTVNETNKSGDTFVSWNWLGANGTASNTDGSITSTVSANTTSGFSIVSYTGTGSTATVGHGLGVAPKMIIIKDRDNGTTSWFVYHSAIGTAGTGRLNTTNAFSDTAFMTTAPSSTLITLTNATIVNGSSEKMIAYCFAEKKGFSKFGSYTGNGSSDGPFVYTGFKPAFVMIKRTDGADQWVIYDNKRIGFNVDNNPVFPNQTDAETTDDDMDILSNGFKIRRNSGRVNTSGGTMIYMAFAENPFVTSTGIPGLAR